MDSDAYTCGTCKHGNLYEAGCDICEAEYERKKDLRPSCPFFTNGQCSNKSCEGCTMWSAKFPRRQE